MAKYWQEAGWYCSECHNPMSEHDTCPKCGGSRYIDSYNGMDIWQCHKCKDNWIAHM